MRTPRCQRVLPGAQPGAQNPANFGRDRRVHEAYPSGGPIFGPVLPPDFIDEYAVVLRPE